MYRFSVHHSCPHLGAKRAYPNCLYGDGGSGELVAAVCISPVRPELWCTVGDEVRSGSQATKCPREAGTHAVARLLRRSSKPWHRRGSSAVRSAPLVALFSTDLLRVERDRVLRRR